MDDQNVNDTPQDSPTVESDASTADTVETQTFEPEPVAFEPSAAPDPQPEPESFEPEADSSAPDVVAMDTTFVAGSDDVTSGDAPSTTSEPAAQESGTESSEAPVDHEISENAVAATILATGQAHHEAPESPIIEIVMETGEAAEDLSKSADLAEKEEEQSDEAHAVADPSQDKAAAEADAAAHAEETPRQPTTEERVLLLEQEIAAAEHKTYHAGKVRKAIAAATDVALISRLQELETQIAAQIEERKGAKEALIARAEEIAQSNQWRKTGDEFKALFDRWKAIGAAGRELDDQLWTRFQTARKAFIDRRTAYFAEQQVLWAAAKEKKEAIVEHAEKIKDSSEWRATADAMKAMQAAWKDAGSAGREMDDVLWTRFNAAKQHFFDRRNAAWEEARHLKEQLIAEAEALKDSTDWRRTADAMKALQTRWKEIGTSGPASEDGLWQRFRAATQHFFERRSSDLTDRNAAEKENLAKKRALCDQAEALAQSDNLVAATRAAKDLQAEWKTIGPVPRDQSEALWQRFRAACDQIFGGAASERERRQGEWEVRLKEALARKREQLAAVRESITHDEANIERWRETLSSLRPGGKSEEIATSLENKILDVADRIRAKRERVEELRATIADMETKMQG